MILGVQPGLGVRFIAIDQRIEAPKHAQEQERELG